MLRSISKKQNKHLEQHYNKNTKKRKDVTKRHVNYAVKLSKQKSIEKDLEPYDKPNSTDLI